MAIWVLDYKGVELALWWSFIVEGLLLKEIPGPVSCLEADIFWQWQALPAAELKTYKGAYSNKKVFF